MIPVLDLKPQFEALRKPIFEAIEGVLRDQHFILGPNVEALEQEVSAFCGCSYGVGVASGTDALILALKAAGVGPGDEVIVPAFTFIATADAVSLLGATPVFADIDPETFNIDLRSAMRHFTRKTKAIIPVHLYGQPADMDPILAWADIEHIAVIEDAAQALGSRYLGQRVPGLGNFGCISFFPSKNLGAYGDGGMIVTNDPDAAAYLRALRAHGSKKKYHNDFQGWNSRLDEMQAAILRVKLPFLDRWNERRRENASVYDELLAGNPHIETPKVSANVTHAFHQYTVRVPHRDRVQALLREQGIQTMIYYPVPLHLQKMYCQEGVTPERLQHSEEAAAQVLSLPMYPELTRHQIAIVSEALLVAVDQATSEATAA